MCSHSRASCYAMQIIRRFHSPTLPPFDYTRCTHIHRCTLHYRPTRSNRETRAASTLYIRGRFSRAWAALMTNRFSTLCMSELANHAQYCSRALQGRIIIDARIYVCVWREVSLARARACVQGFSFFFHIEARETVSEVSFVDKSGKRERRKYPVGKLLLLCGAMAVPSPRERRVR